MELYFESAATILTLITLGKYLEEKSKGKTTEAIKKLVDLTPKKATVERNGRETEVPVEEVAAGDIVTVRRSDIPSMVLLREARQTNALTGKHTCR